MRLHRQDRQPKVKWCEPHDEQGVRARLAFLRCLLGLAKSPVIEAVRHGERWEG